MASERRIVVTGVGAITPLGIGVNSTWELLCKGKSGIAQITRFDTKDFPVQIGGEVKNFNPQEFINKKDIKKMDFFIQYALTASIMAARDSGLEISENDSERVGVIIGAGIGGLPAIEKWHDVLQMEGPRKVTPFFIPMVITNLAAGHVSMYLGAKGPNSSAVTACATGNHSIGDAYRIIERGEADVMIAGGTEATLTPLCVAGFNAMKALSTRNDDPEAASRPFDRDRDGFVIGEGAGIVILEELERAKKRDAKIYAEIKGYGMNSDAYHMTTPSPDGEGAAKCMELALNDAGIGIEEVDYINAHGTSTYYNDLYETMAIKKVFGDHSRKLAVSSTKSMIGHLLGGAGGVEAVFTVLSIDRGVMPPTINYENPDPECDLDYVPNTAREKKIDVAMTNSFGFGGTNAVLVLQRFTK